MNYKYIQSVVKKSEIIDKSKIFLQNFNKVTADLTYIHVSKAKKDFSLSQNTIKTRFCNKQFMVKKERLII